MAKAAAKKHFLGSESICFDETLFFSLLPNLQQKKTKDTAVAQITDKKIR
jgi:hypothetical protein